MILIVIQNSLKVRIINNFVIKTKLSFEKLN